MIIGKSDCICTLLHESCFRHFVSGVLYHSKYMVCTRIYLQRSHALLKLVSDSGQPPALDFKVDVMTCKATVSSISEILQNCIELISLQEDAFAKCLEQEINKRSQLEEMYGQNIIRDNSNKKNENEVRLCMDFIGL